MFEIKSEQIAQLQQLYRQEFGEDLPQKEAERIGHDLVWIIYFIYDQL